MIIKNNTDGKTAGVTKDHQLRTQAESHSLAHHIAVEHENVYVISTNYASVTAATNTLLHIVNDDPQRDLVLSQIAVEAITDTASKPVSGEYFQTGFGTTRSSGGTLLTALNTNSNSGKVAAVTAYGENPTVTGTFVEGYRKYHEGSAKETNLDVRDGSLITLGTAFEIRLVSAGAGVAKVFLAFIMLDKL